MKNNPFVSRLPSRAASWLGLALIVAAFPLRGRSAETEVPRVAMPLMRETPKIDGRIDEVE